MPEWSRKIPCGDSGPLGSINKKRWCKNCNSVALFRRYSHLTYVFKFSQNVCYSMDCGKQHRSARLLLSGVWLLCDLVSGDKVYNTWTVEAYNIISCAWNWLKLRWHTWIRGELDDCVCFRIKFHLLLFSHSRITGISDRGVLYESLFRSFSNIWEDSTASIMYTLLLEVACSTQMSVSVKTENDHRINACCKIMDTCIRAWHISPELQLPDALVVTVNNSRLRNVKWEFHCIVSSSVQ